MVGENDVSAGGNKFGRMKNSLRHLGVDKAKYQAKLIDYKQSQKFILDEIVKKAHELATHLNKEMKETKQALVEIQNFLNGIGADAKTFETLANTIRTGENQARSRGEQKMEFGGEQLRGTSKKSVKEFRERNSELKKETDKIGKAIKKDEEELKKVLVLLEYLRLLIQYYYEVDDEIKKYRKRDIVFTKKELRDIDHETDKAMANAASGGNFDKSLEKENAAVSGGTGFE